MAIYRTGTASITENGVITGTGTKWQSALSLLRVGATILFLRDQIHLATIAAIMSDTELRATDYDGVALSDGPYAILLHDSITVDGLAQDIAETLRYYQSQESNLGQLTETIQSYVKAASDSATFSAASATEATRQAGLAKDQVTAATQQATASANSATESENSNKASAASASAAKTSETNAGTQATNAANSASAAKTSEENAGTQATNAANSAAAAKTSENNAASTLSSAALKDNNLSDLANKATAWTNLLTARTAASARADLGLGAAALLGVGKVSGTVADGNDSRLNTIDGKSGGAVSSLVNVKGDILSQSVFGDNTQGRWSSEVRTVLDGWGRPDNAPSGVNGAYFSFATIAPAAAGSPVQGQITASSYWHGTKRWYFPFDTGNAIAPGTWVSNSDERIKTKIQRIDDPLGKMRMIKGVTWERLDNASPGIGFIAQDVQAVFPDSVFVSGDRTLKDGTIVKDILSPDTSGVSAALHHEAILALMDIIEKQSVIIDELQSRMKDIDGIDA